ncbi:protein FLX-like 1 [Canna indica]|uniref:Protein FLX-like 1 n=1 Tax=Canna indica TaxID=4628 RepID=A0AAQ3KTS8_9LILI|nr:protein FLX-like 1 [Canna indica]
MSRRSRMPLHGTKGSLPRHDSPTPPFGGRGLGPIHPAALLEEMRDGPPFGLHARHALHPAIIEERIAAQHQDIQGLLSDNQHLAATHVALKQELDAAQHEIGRMSCAVASIQADKDQQLREVYDKSMKLESELRAIEAMREELVQVRRDIGKLNAVRQELTNQAEALNQDLSRASAEMQQTPAIKAEIEAIKQEVQHVRAVTECEKKGHSSNYEQGQVMEKNLISMAREVEKLRAEIANAEKRARAAAAAGNQASCYGGYGGNYGNPDPNYGANPYSPGFNINPVAGAMDAGFQYGSVSVHGSWDAYEMQRAQGRR